MWPEGQELLEVIWQTYPSGKFTEKPITNIKLEGIKSTQPQASAQAYKPPNARGINITPTRTSTNNDNRIPGAAPPKSNRKDRRNQRPVSFSKNRSDENNDASNNETAQSIDAQSQTFRPLSRDNAKKSNRPNSQPEDPEKLKRKKALNKKLSDISKLKMRREKGEHLELNQIQKIDSEAALIKELNDLKIT